MEFLSKKVTDSVGGAPGSSVSMSDMVNTEKKPEEAPVGPGNGKMSNSDIMSFINSMADG